MSATGAVRSRDVVKVNRVESGVKCTYHPGTFNSVAKMLNDALTHPRCDLFNLRIIRVSTKLASEYADRDICLALTTWIARLSDPAARAEGRDVAP